MHLFDRHDGAVIKATTRASRQPEKVPASKWLNTLIVTLRTAIAGTQKAIRRAHVERYFTELQFRFNGRHYQRGPFTT